MHKRLLKTAQSKHVIMGQQYHIEVLQKEQQKKKACLVCEGLKETD